MPALHATGGSIPFNSRPAFPLTSLLHVFLACAALLALFVIGLVFAHRKGWLRRFSVPPNRQQGVRAVDLRQTLRLSPHTTVFVLAHGATEYLVVESTRHVAITRSVLDGDKESKT